MSWRAPNRPKDAKTPSQGPAMSKKTELGLWPVQPYRAFGVQLAVAYFASRRASNGPRHAPTPTPITRAALFCFARMANAPARPGGTRRDGQPVLQTLPALFTSRADSQRPEGVLAPELQAPPMPAAAVPWPLFAGWRMAGLAPTPALSPAQAQPKPFYKVLRFFSA
jgi:hypothetical protein